MLVSILELWNLSKLTWWRCYWKSQLVASLSTHRKIRRTYTIEISISIQCNALCVIHAWIRRTNYVARFRMKKQTKIFQIRTYYWSVQQRQIRSKRQQQQRIEIWPAYSKIVKNKFDAHHLYVLQILTKTKINN